MDIEQLRQLDAVARLGSLSAATRVCHVSQSALSRSIQRLEAECGTKLFVRTNTSMDLNDAGEIVLEHARAILREERAMHDSIGRLLQRERMLIVGTVAPAPVWLITELTVEKYPGTIFQVDYIKNSDAPTQLLDGSIDMAITSEPIDVPGCSSTHLFDEKLSLLLPAGHHLAGNKSVTFAQMEGETFLVDSIAGFWISMIRSNVPHARIIEQADRNILFQLIRSSGLLTFVTNVTESWGIPNGFKVIPIEDEIAHVSFYLTALPHAPKRVTEIVQLADRNSARGEVLVPTPISVPIV